MRKEWVVVVIIIIVAGWWLLSQKKEEVPVVKCPSACEYGCIPNTVQCREAPPLACPSTCLWGCFPNTTECKPGVVEPKKNQITKCGVINESSELAAPLTSQDTCLRIENDDVTIDCKDYPILGEGKLDSYGIEVNGRRNVTIKNCVVKNYASGVYTSHSSRISLLNLQTEENMESGISIVSSDEVVIDGVKASRNLRFGIEITSSNTIQLLGNLLTNNPLNLVLHFSKNLTLRDNQLCSSPKSLECIETEIAVESDNVCEENNCGVVCSPCS